MIRRPSPSSAALSAGVGPYFLARHAAGMGGDGPACPPRFVSPVPRPADLIGFAVAEARAVGLREFAYGGYTVVVARPRTDRGGRGLKRTA